mgnify:CR=1 FL=1|tara:strand:+ start:33591 stop:34409 length:819 start_codon:yes stop_codon:yes gene_type:complete
MIKNLFKNIINNLTEKLYKTSFGQYITEILINEGMEKKRKISYRNIEMFFSVPNRLNKYRVDSFSIKEPETLDWIDEITENSIVWDIGANIGLYTIYAAKSKNCKVYAFEPSFFNLELLARNIYINNLQNNIIVIPVSVNKKLDENVFQLSSTQWGGALSTFGAGIDQDGEPINTKFEYKTIGLSMEDMRNKLKIPAPDYVKIDVDGIEHLILSGGIDVLKNVKSILIEINDSFIEQSNVTTEILKKSGFLLFKKCRLQGSKNQFNQWWVRK